MLARNGAPEIPDTKENAPVGAEASKNKQERVSANNCTPQTTAIQAPVLVICDPRRGVSRKSVRAMFRDSPNTRRIGKRMLRMSGPLVAAMIVPGDAVLVNFTEAQLEEEVLAFHIACTGSGVGRGTILHSVADPLKARIDAAIASTWRIGGTA